MAKTIGPLQAAEKLGIDTNLQGFVTGHDFSRAANSRKKAGLWPLGKVSGNSIPTWSLLKMTIFAAADTRLLSPLRSTSKRPVRTAPKPVASVVYRNFHMLVSRSEILFRPMGESSLLHLLASFLKNTFCPHWIENAAGAESRHIGHGFIGSSAPLLDPVDHFLGQA